jgi:hypothetical protein
MLPEPESIIIGFQVTQKDESSVGNHGGYGMRYSKNIIQRSYAVFMVLERGRHNNIGFFAGIKLAAESATAIERGYVLRVMRLCPCHLF